MPEINDLTLVSMDNVHVIIPNYITQNQIIISSYEDIMNTVLKMIKEKYFFNMDKNILRGCMEDLTYMYCPGDDVNKDRVLEMLAQSEDEDDDDDEDEDEDDDHGGDSIPHIMEKLIISDVSDTDM